MDRFHAIATFAKVVETGSFVRAAERLAVSVSAVSRAVADLEAHLDARLLNRTTRRLSLTESGKGFYERAVQLLADLEEAEESAQAATVVPRGTLRITSSITFGARHLASAIAAFMERYPAMRFDVELSDRAIDLVEEGFDLAVRIGAIGSQHVVARRVATTELLCCAAPSYVARHGEPREPGDLVGHACLTYAYAAAGATWVFRDATGKAIPVEVAGPLHANHGGFLEAMAVEGVGITQAPDFILGPELRAGRLVRLLERFEPQPSPISLAYPSRRHLSAKVRTFVDFMAARFVQPEWWIAPTPPARKGSSRR